MEDGFCVSDGLEDNGKVLKKKDREDVLLLALRRAPKVPTKWAFFGAFLLVFLFQNLALCLHAWCLVSYERRGKLNRRYGIFFYSF